MTLSCLEAGGRRPRRGYGAANSFVNLLINTDSSGDYRKNVSNFINNVLLCSSPYNNLQPKQKEFFGLLAIALWKLLYFINDNYLKDNVSPLPV
jgi:hypothetical protein